MTIGTTRGRDSGMVAPGITDNGRMSVPTVESLAELLLRDWDPLGVAETDESPEAEYRSEARELRMMLARGTNVDEIVDYLASRRLDRGKRSRDQQVAQLLIALVE